MGYYTKHELTIVYGNDAITNYKEEISEIAGYSNTFDDCCKWYSLEEDMRAYSLKHPETLFKINGEGDDAGDVWIKYFLNGKMQHAKAQITFEDYDSSKLQ